MNEPDTVISTRTGPFKVDADFDGVELKRTATYVVQLCNDSAHEQRVTVNNPSGALIISDNDGLPFRDCTIVKNGKVCVVIGWTPRRVHFLDERVELLMHGKRSVQLHCSGTAVPSFGSTSPDENSQPNLFSPATGLCVDTISMRSGSGSSGTACTSPSARMQRVHSRMRRSLSHIHEAFDDKPRSRSRAGRISREPSVENYNRRASIGVASECSIASRRSLSSSSRKPFCAGSRNIQIQPPEIGRRASLSSQSMRSVGSSAEPRQVTSRPQSARSVSAAAWNRGASASGRASARGNDASRGPPSRTMRGSTERRPTSQSRAVLSSDKSSCQLSAEALKRLSSSLSPRKSVQGMNTLRSRVFGQPSGHRAPSSVAPTLPVRNSRTSSLRSTIHQMPSATPRHKEKTESFAIYHTENWQKKQDRAFTQWLNMVLGESYKETSSSQEAAVNRTVLLRCRQQLGHLRENDDVIVHALNQVEQQIKANRLSFKENSFLDDAALRKKAVRAIMSYHPLWLRLGIDTVLNRRTFQEGDQDSLGAVSSADLEAVVREELLSDSTLLGGASLIRRGDRREFLSQLVIYRVLTLVILLDRIPSKMQLPQQAPFLFRLGSEFKSSEEVLVEVLHASLSGVGKLSKHLAKMHYEVSFKQRDVDEWPMRVSSLATDLSNGIILCKLVTLLLGKDVMPEVRRPTAAQRVIKVRNVRIALAAASAAGIDLAELSANRGEANEHVTVKVDDILSGHCREVLAFLWAVAAKSFERTVPVPHLQTEVRLLERKIKNKGLAPDSNKFSLQPGNNSPVACLLFEWVRAVCGLYGVTVRNCGSSFTDGSALCLLIHHYVPSLVPWTSIQIPPPVPLDVAQQMLGSSHLGGLASLSWADYIGMQNSVIQEDIEEHKSGIVHNFELINKASRCLGEVPDMLSADDITSRYCDERAVLLFLSSLCPRLLAFANEGKAAHAIAKWWRWARVRLITLNPGELSLRVRVYLHKEAVQAKWRHLADRVHRIPFQHRLEAARAHRDSAKKAVLRFRVAVRCTVLAVRMRKQAAVLQNRIEKERLQREVHRARLQSAAAVIQAHYRGFVVRRQAAMQRTAASKIAIVWRLYKQRQASRAAVVIQCRVRGWRARQQIMQRARAACTIQRHARGTYVRTQLCRQSCAALHIQTTWRMHVCRMQYLHARDCVVMVQAAARGMMCRSLCMRQRHAARKIQAAWRRHCARRRLAIRRHAATVIQAHLRAAAVRKRLQSMRAAVSVIQAALRMQSARRTFLAQKQAAVSIQAAWRRRQACAAFAHSVAAIQTIQTFTRGFLVRLRLRNQHHAAVVIQAAVRGSSCRMHFIRCRRSIIAIQAAVRGRAARLQFLKALDRVVLLQACVRRQRLQRAFRRQRSAAVRIQAAVRGARVRAAFRRQHAAAKVLQSTWRAHCCRRLFAADVRHVVCCQAFIRGFLVRRCLAQQHSSAVLIQKHWRGYQCRRMWVSSRHLVVRLQARARGAAARRSFHKQRSAAIFIQSYARMWLAVQELRGVQIAAVCMQAHCRMWRCKVQFQRQRAAAAVVQKAWRAHAAATRQRCAAVCIQSWWRRAHVRSQMKASTAAAVRIQSTWRGVSCRKQVACWHAAAIVIQKNMAMFLVQRRLVRQKVAVWRIEAAVAAFQYKRLVQQQQRADAARCLQRVWKVHVVRKQVQRRCAALAVITRMLPQMRAACSNRREARRLQALAVAVAPIQAAVRGWIQRRRFKQQHLAAVTIQAFFRGRAVRVATSHEVKQMARRLKRLERLPDDHSQCLGPRVMAALTQLLSSNSVEQARSACEAAAWGTTYSRNACAWLVRDGALPALARFLRACSTNKSHSSILTSILTILVNMLSHSEAVLHIDVQELAGLVPVVTDLLQLYRDTEGVFTLAVSVLQKSCARSGLLSHLALERMVVKWKGVYRVLYTRLQKEGLYLSKLENKKGSDVSACNATRTLIQTSEQLKALKQLIKPLHKVVVKKLADSSHARHAPANHADVLAELPQPGPGDWIHEITKGGSMWVPKNTKVRATFREVLDNVHGFELPEASEEEESNLCSGGGVADTADSMPLLPSGQVALAASRKGVAAVVHDTASSENVNPEAREVF